MSQVNGNPNQSDPHTPSASGVFDLGSKTDQERVRQLADAIVAGDAEPRSPRDQTAPIDARIAAHLASSKQTVHSLQWDGTVAVVFAMWGERRRLRPRTDDNPTGEDALHVKLDQLSWLFSGTPTDWRVYAVDDGDPEDSAEVAIERAGLHPAGHRVSVLRLADLIPADAGPLVRLDHVDGSRKGGAMIAGAARAVADDCDAIVLTDADNSVNLGQLGLLLGPFCGGAGAVIGDRKHPDSVLVKAEARWGPGIVVLRHMQRMAGRALFATGLRDTQAAFKLYGRQALDNILASPSTFGFAFDSDWLYSVLSGGTPIERTPFAFIDSIEDSASITQGPMTTWESLLRGLVAAARARGVDHDTDMAQLIDDYANAETLELVVQNVPPELEGANDAQLGDPALMTAQQLRTWLNDLTGTSG
ncbi:MAG: glycosyltransferase [Acidimicrobiales bacterium]